VQVGFLEDGAQVLVQGISHMEVLSSEDIGGDVEGGLVVETDSDVVGSQGLESRDAGRR